MSFEEAGGEDVNANPHYLENNKYINNCQSAAVAYDARRKGFNVTAADNIPGSKSEELSKDFFSAWIDPKTGNTCEGIVIGSFNNNCYQYLEEAVK